MKEDIISVLKKHGIKCNEILINDLLSLLQGDLKTKKEHEILEEYLNEKYDKNLLDNNVSRVINKNTPQNPDKSMR